MEINLFYNKCVCKQNLIHANEFVLFAIVFIYIIINAHFFCIVQRHRKPLLPLIN